MQLDDKDRCPRCGTPFTSPLLPGESAVNRYCYTCVTAMSNATVAARMNQQGSDDDLALEPLTTSGSEHKPHYTKRKFFPKPGLARKPPPPAKMPAPKAAPAVPGPDLMIAPANSSTPAAAAVAPAGPTAVIQPPALLDKPVVAPLQQKPAATSVSSSPAKAAHIHTVKHAGHHHGHKPQPTSRFAALGLIGGLAVVVALVVYLVWPSKPKPAPAASMTVMDNSQAATPAESAPRASAGATTKVSAATPAADQKMGAIPAAGDRSKPAAIQQAAILPAAPGRADKQPIDTADKTQVMDALLGGTRKAANAKASDDDEALADMRKAAAAKKPADAKATPPDVDLAKTENPVVTGTEEGLDDEKKKGPVDPMKAILGKNNPKAVEEKKADAPPPPPPPIPVTSTEPTVMPFDTSHITGNDRALSEMLHTVLPNWRTKDINRENTRFGLVHNGRDKVLVINPLNDVLPGELIATIEIPKGASRLKPTLAFEVSSKEPGKVWTLAVRSMGVEILPKEKIKCSKDSLWQDVFVDLSAFDDKHFDLSIECYGNKNNKKFKEELSYLRNVRLEWIGRKAEAAPLP